MKSKNSILVLLLLASSVALGCWWYPSGEDIRFKLLDPKAFRYGDYSTFNFSARLFGDTFYREDQDTVAIEANPNEKLWLAYCKNNIRLADVREVMADSLEQGIFSDNTTYAMIGYLRAQKDSEALDYLRFAKECEKFTSFSDNPWETENAKSPEGGKEKIEQGLAKLAVVKNPEIAKRYAFLLIRLSFYEGESERVRSLFKQHFSTIGKDAVYYWALYFDSMQIKDQAFQNFMFAQIFANSPDKREATWTFRNSKIKVSDVLKYAKTNVEKANVLAFYATFRHDPVLSELKKIHALDPNSEWLGFLLLREMNKLEDWIFTPYYFVFQPSIASNDYQEEEPNSVVILKRSERDRKYAKLMLDFVQSANKSKVADAELWQISEAELHLMCRNYDASISKIDALLSRKVSNPKIRDQARLVKALALTGRQPNGNAVILPEIEPVLLANKTNSDFLFSIGKELERKGNFTQAGLLYAVTLAEDGDFWNGSVYWRKEGGKFEGYYSDFYYDYFDYLNIFATPEQLAGLVSDTEKRKDASGKSDFDRWLYKRTSADLNVLKDLLGTKYMRRNDLANAKKAFDQIPANYWLENYSLWEKNGRITQYSEGANIFDGNPFFEFKHTPDFMPKKDVTRLNKATVLNQLLVYIAKAENPKQINRDYYAFLVANCYYNMTESGNSWMMNRFNYSGSISAEINVEGDRDFRGCTFAKAHYLQAYKLATDHKFKMLCLRMAGTCHENLVNYDTQFDQKAKDAWVRSDSWESNPYFKEMFDDFPFDYRNLEGTCGFFSEYFRERGKRL
ncbi:hypothetical protein [Flavobacterium sp.]|uniref:hypothetical protein n=1 Tax=Flavobacterium sp. TaxID=239 RepID=UPI00122A50B3|nr:hypothetical protein [Flavobacterium sp.]RZJ69079.1 MAG: hypothetical protein EOO49_18715 [Flavobacterium sp.]